MEGTTTLNSERAEFAGLDHNNQRAVLGFVIDKSRNSQEICEICTQAYKRKFCLLCEDLRNNKNPSELYQEITSGKEFEL